MDAPDLLHTISVFLINARDSKKRFFHFFPNSVSLVCNPHLSGLRRRSLLDEIFHFWDAPVDETFISVFCVGAVQNPTPTAVPIISRIAPFGGWSAFRVNGGDWDQQRLVLGSTVRLRLSRGGYLAGMRYGQLITSYLLFTLYNLIGKQ